MKFIIDMPLSYKLAQFLREKGYDAFYLSEQQIQRATDEQIFELAINENRIIVTADLDFSKIFALSLNHPAGLILFREGNLSDTQMIDSFKRLIDFVPPEKIMNSIIVVEQNRIRITPLPIADN